MGPRSAAIRRRIRSSAVRSSPPPGRAAGRAGSPRAPRAPGTCLAGGEGGGGRERALGGGVPWGEGPQLGLPAVDRERREARRRLADVAPAVQQPRDRVPEQ